MDLERFNHEMARTQQEQKQLEGREPDAMTDFSIMTDESDILPNENILDLRISTANINRVNFTTLVSGHEINPNDV